MATRQLGKPKWKRDWESASRADDAPGEEGEALRRDREDDPAATEYEVFLSFRGPDTRAGFTDCLYRRLRLAGVHVFRDNEELRVGKEIGGELSKALDKSRIYIPIFSRSYAASSWCLREVAHMVEGISKSDGKKEILPIFYDVNPDDVKLKTKLYKEAIPKHEKKFGSDELKRWEAALVKMTKKLKVLDLTGCTKLTITPDFSNFMSLEMLILAWCSKLITIQPSIGKLELLKTLNIKGCSSLGELTEEVGSLHSLTQIVMPQNYKLLKLPERFGNLKSLSSFILDEHPEINQLPKSIGGLVKLTRLSLRGCVGIKELPCSIGELQMLVELDVSRSGINILPNSIGKLKKLRVMRIDHTKIDTFPPTIRGVEMLEEIHARGCWNLIDGHLEEIGEQSQLRILDLSYTDVRSLPKVIGRLSHLQKLQLGGSTKLQPMTALPSSLTWLELQASDFSFVHDLSSLINLDYLKLYRLASAALPHSSRSYDLQKLKADWMKMQLSQPLPSHLSALKLKGISLLPHLSNLERLSVLHVTASKILCLPVSEGLIHLTELKISRCVFLEVIPGLSLLKRLQRLVLNSLNRLVGIEGLSELESLQYLHLSSCGLIRELPNLSKLNELQHVELEGCHNLRAIEGVEGLERWKLDHGHFVLERLLDVSRTTWLCHRLPSYDVFLSFWGLDTGHGFTDALYQGLVDCGTSVCREDHELSFDDGIGEQMERAIEASPICIPIFSPNYASSPGRLRALAHMVKCMSKSKGQKRILPIFYDVEICDVELESKLYGGALDKHRKYFHHDEVKAWEEALRKIARMEGFQVKTYKSHAEAVKQVTREVLRARQLFDIYS